ncbi:MAG: O-antigen ligase family protein [Daejeonella sp.]
MLNFISKNLLQYKIYIFPLAGIILSLIVASRAFCIGYFITLLFFILRNRNFKLSFGFLSFSFLSILLLIIPLIFYFKTASSQGRLLIYKISGRIFSDHWLHGIGLGKFKTTYLYYQADYFRSGDYTVKELLLADNTYYAFNDYFQFIIETGLIGVVLIIITFLSFTYLIIKANKNSKSFILILACGQLIAILTAALFNYVLCSLSVQLAIIICISIIMFFALKIKFIYKCITISFITIMLFILALGIPYRFNPDYFYALQQIPNIKELDRTGFKLEARQKLASVAGVLHENSEYLELYSQQQAAEGDLENALNTLKKLIKKSVSNNLYVRLGNIYSRLGKSRNAEQAYLMAVYMVPNRFQSRYILYQFYRETGQYQKAISCAKSILALPVKIPSDEVEQIKSRVAKDLTHSF